MGGEKIVAVPEKESLEGSPPRRRGKEALTPWASQLPGITPAWAGKRCQGRFLLKYPWDYPRVGGEKAAAARVSTSSSGLPPRGRGQGSRRYGGFTMSGITPARAGKSSAPP